MHIDVPAGWIVSGTGVLQNPQEVLTPAARERLTHVLESDNVITIVGNGKIFADTIQNYTSNPFRRVELKAQLAGSADHRAAIALLKEKIAAIPNVLADPAVDVEILEFNLVGPVLAVRPYTHNDNYWQVYFDTNRTIKEALAEGGFPAPTPSQALTITTPGQLAGLTAVAQSTTTPTSVN